MAGLSGLRDLDISYNRFKEFPTAALAGLPHGTVGRKPDAKRNPAAAGAPRHSEALLSGIGPTMYEVCRSRPGVLVRQSLLMHRR